MRYLVVTLTLVTACGTAEEPDIVLSDAPACWYEDGDPTLHKYYPKGHAYSEEFEMDCERLGKPAEGVMI